MRFATVLLTCMLLLTACNIGYNSIQDITFYPEKYEGKIVKVKGTSCLSIGFLGNSYLCLQDQYENIIKLTESCGGQFSDSFPGKEYIAYGHYSNGWINCLVPIYKEGNEPPKVKEYEGGKLTPEGVIVTSSKCKNVVKEGNLEKCAD
ncbi:hypothetical protein J4480_03575 [Candidatus Woesearchaeota archaeon]|nr:hypothetical protein [Candidatus Woesearchaeota archaeon]